MCKFFYTNRVKCRKTNGSNRADQQDVKTITLYTRTKGRRRPTTRTTHNQLPYTSHVRTVRRPFLASALRRPDCTVRRSVLPHTYKR